MKELKVGEYFNYCGKKYIVVEDATGNCWNCAFGCSHVVEVQEVATIVLSAILLYFQRLKHHQMKDTLTFGIGKYS